jgi:hypothetical protein
MAENRNEIDLIELFVRIYIYLKKYIWLLIIFMAAAIIYSYVSHKFLAKSYKSEMILSIKQDTDYMYAFTFQDPKTQRSDKYCVIVQKLINTLSSRLEAQNYEELSNELNLDVELLKNISSLEGSFTSEDNRESFKLFSVEVYSKSNELFETMGYKLETYLNNNKHIKEQKHSDSIILTSLIHKTNQELKELDSIQAVLLQNKSNKSDIVFYQNLSYATETIKLQALKEKLSMELNALDKVEIIDDFYLPQVSESSLFKKLFTSILIALSIFFLVIFYLYIKQKSKEFNTKPIK